MNHNTSDPQSEDEHRSEIAFSPSIMAAVSFLPVNKVRETNYVTRTNGRMSITVSAGRDGEWAYGKIPRLFILYIQTLITRHDPCVDEKTRTVYIDGSFGAVCEKIGLTKSGMMKRMVVDQISYLARTDFVVVQDLSEGPSQISERSRMFHFADDARISFPQKNGERNYVRLSEPMWEILSKTSIPVDLTLISRLGNSARAIDVFLWLSYRMNSMRGDQIRVPWDKLMDQFDGGETESDGGRNFRKKFRQSVLDIRRLWPELKVDVDRDGVVVHRCRPLIASQREGMADGWTVVEVGGEVGSSDGLPGVESVPYALADVRARLGGLADGVSDEGLSMLLSSFAPDAGSLDEAVESLRLVLESDADL